MPRTIAQAAGAFWLLMAALTAPIAAAQIVCLAVEGDQRKTTVEVAVGDSLTLAFTHSIYRSEVEERFRIGPRTFRPIELRYAEQRLVEFYGHESARHADGWWVVDGSRAELIVLDLRASRDASMRLVIREQQLILGGHVRLSVSACQGDQNG